VAVFRIQHDLEKKRTGAFCFALSAKAAGQQCGNRSGFQYWHVFSGTQDGEATFGIPPNRGPRILLGAIILICAHCSVVVLPGCKPGDSSCNPFSFSILFATSSCNPVLYSGQMQGCPLHLKGAVSNFAGSGGAGSANGQGSAASFNYPTGSSSDGRFIYIADSSNGLIRRIEIDSAIVTTIASGLSTPRAVSTDGRTLYIAAAGSNQILRLDPVTGVTTVLAGSGTAGFVDGVGTAAQLNFPQGVTVDAGIVYAGTLFTVVKIDATTATVTTIAGSSTAGSQDGIGAAAGFQQVMHLVKLGSYLYLNDGASGANHAFRRVHIETGEVVTLAGGVAPGGADGFGIGATFNAPYGVTTDGTAVYITDSDNHLIRKYNPATGQVTTLAGSYLVSGTTEGIGPAALFGGPRGITTDGSSLFISDAGSNLIRRMR